MKETLIEETQISGPVDEAQSQILTKEALSFLTTMSRTFEARRQQLLQARCARQQRIDQGEMPDFLPETAALRASQWTVAPIPSDLLDRRVEITGPVDRKMIINALNSGASVFMADFEDANSPTWQNNLNGQINLRDAVRGTISYKSPEGKSYTLGNKTATLMVRPRGWHLDEKHLLVDGKPISASLFDFGLYFFHNARELMKKAPGPISTCRNWRAIWKRGCGTMSSISPRTSWASRVAQSDARCSSRPFWQHSKWTRSCSSYASIRPGSTAAGGITSSASSRNFATTLISCCRTGPRSRWTGIS